MDYYTVIANIVIGDLYMKGSALSAIGDIKVIETQILLVKIYII